MVSPKRELRKVGLTVTMSRIKVLDVLASAQTESRHLRAEEIYKCLMSTGDSMSVGTIYRVLAQLEMAGLVVRHNFDTGQARYELAGDDRHDHMVCMDSGEIIEFRDQQIIEQQKRIAKEQGYELVDYRLVLFVCKDIRTEKSVGGA
jgi:Fur family ferric uptake transcriptional regulator